MPEIDYLPEDPIISHQRFACITIIGPKMPQHCTVWGIKIRGVSGDLEESRNMAKRLSKIDPNYNVYVVEIGKFFPLDIDPNEIKESEYQNEQLNQLMKSYIENKNSADDLWQERKQKMVNDAIKEGKNNIELQKKEEHPVAVLQRAKNTQEKIDKLKDEMQNALKDLQFTNDKFKKYTTEEQEFAKSKFDGEISLESFDPLTIDMSKVFDELQGLDGDVAEIKNRINSTNEEHSPNLYKQLSCELKDLLDRKEYLKTFVSSHQDLANEFVNKNKEDTKN